MKISPRNIIHDIRKIKSIYTTVPKRIWIPAIEFLEVKHGDKAKMKASINVMRIFTGLNIFAFKVIYSSRIQWSEFEEGSWNFPKHFHFDFSIFKDVFSYKSLQRQKFFQGKNNNFFHIK